MHSGARFERADCEIVCVLYLYIYTLIKVCVMGRAPRMTILIRDYRVSVSLSLYRSVDVSALALSWRPPAPRAGERGRARAPCRVRGRTAGLR